MHWLLASLFALVVASGCAKLGGFEDLEGAGGSSDASAGARQSGAGGAPGGAPGVAGAHASGSGGIAGGMSAGAAGLVVGGGDAGTSSASGGGRAGGGGGEIGSCGEPLIRDGAFDELDGAWVERSTFGAIPIVVSRTNTRVVQAGVLPLSGDHLAWLGGVPKTDRNHYVTLDQVVTIPPEALVLVLSGAVWVTTAEDSDAEYDSFYIQLMDNAEDERALWLPRRWTNLDASAGWVSFELETTDLDHVRGRTVLLRVESHTDPDVVTSFWVDSLRLEARCSR